MEGEGGFRANDIRGSAEERRTERKEERKRHKGENRVVAILLEE